MNLQVAPIHVANWFVARGMNQGKPLTHMQVQKLTYLTHGYWLQKNDEPLLFENPQVWPYGPVFNSIWTVLREFKSSPIDQLDPSAERIRAPDAVAVAEQVWDQYGELSGNRLSDLTHRVGTPWQRQAALHNYRVPRGLEIPVELVREHYRSVVEDLEIA